MTDQPLKILIVCEHASNKFGGEAMLPLNYFRLLSKQPHTVYLVTHERAKASLENLTELDQSKIYYIPDTRVHKLLHRLSTFLPHRLGVVTFGALLHLLTQFYQRKIVKKLIAQEQIDIVHEPAPVSARQPSALFNIKAPTVIGPLNGGMTFPDAFMHMSGKLEQITYSFVRSTSNIYNRLIPGKIQATVVLVANQRTAEALPCGIKGKVEELVENGTFSIKQEAKTGTKSKSPTIIYVGRLVDWKCLDIAIDAVANTKSKASLKIIGDGPERQRLEQQVKNKNLSNIEFVGMIPHTQVNQYYDDADIFVLPSVRECGGAVVLEAMSRGLPVIATNWGGPADYITDDTGYLVNPTSRGYMVDEFTRIIDELACSPQLRHKYGQAAIDRIRQHFLWDEKIQQIIHHYRIAIDLHNNRQ